MDWLKDVQTNLKQIEVGGDGWMDGWVQRRGTKAQNRGNEPKTEEIQPHISIILHLKVEKPPSRNRGGGGRRRSFSHLT